MDFKVGKYSVFNFPMQNENRVAETIAGFHERNMKRFDPKENDRNQLQYIKNEATFLGVYTEVAERRAACKHAIEIDLNADEYQIQCNAFEALGMLEASEYSSSMRNMGQINPRIYISIQGIGRAYKLFANYAQLSERHVMQHQEINFKLASEYYQIATAHSEFRNEDIRDYGSDTPEYFEALCIFHFDLASNLGHAKSSFELAKITYENEFFLPHKWRDDNIGKAEELARRAEVQAAFSQDYSTLNELEAWRDQIAWDPLLDLPFTLIKGIENLLG